MATTTAPPKAPGSASNHKEEPSSSPSSITKKEKEEDLDATTPSVSATTASTRSSSSTSSTASNLAHKIFIEPFVQLRDRHDEILPKALSPFLFAMRNHRRNGDDGDEEDDDDEEEEEMYEGEPIRGANTNHIRFKAHPSFVPPTNCDDLNRHGYQHIPNVGTRLRQKDFHSSKLIEEVYYEELSVLLQQMIPMSSHVEFVSHHYIQGEVYSRGPCTTIVFSLEDDEEGKTAGSPYKESSKVVKTAKKEDDNNGTTTTTNTIDTLTDENSRYMHLKVCRNGSLSTQMDKEVEYYLTNDEDEKEYISIGRYDLLIFKQYDSQGDAKTSSHMKLVATVEEDAKNIPPKESLAVNCIVYF